MKHKTVLLKGAMYVRRTVGLSNGPRDRVDISKKLSLELCSDLYEYGGL